MQALESLNPTLVLAMALTLVAVAMLVLGVSMVRRLRGQGRSRQVVDQALATRSGRSKAAEAESRAAWPAAARAADSFGKRLTEGRLAEALLASEDRVGRYGGLRESGGGAVALRGGALRAGHPAAHRGGGAGPGEESDRFLGRRADRGLPGFRRGLHAAEDLRAPAAGAPAAAGGRRTAAADRPAAPAAGRGLSIDQSLQVLVKEFAQVLPVLSYELRLATEQHVRDARASNRWRGWRRASTTTISRPSAD